MRSLIAAVFFFITMSSAQQKEIYRNEKYSVTSVGIIDGQYKAESLPDGGLRSNYLPAFTESINRIATFKFALNGLDNERAPGKDHRVFLNPNNGVCETPLYVFGEADPVGSDMVQGIEYPIPQNQPFTVVFRVDMRGVMKQLNEKGYVETYNGGRIAKNDFKGVYIAGGQKPLTWDFQSLAGDSTFKMTDPNNDGIFEIGLHFANSGALQKDNEGFYNWHPTKDLSKLPVFNSEYPILNSLYSLSLEEMLLDAREDGAYMAGAKWTGVWTRDVSYSILLSLAILQPDACKTTLMAKVKNGMIIQDTGTGGAWPVSTDRMVWSLAAYEIYLTTGDRQWLNQIFEIITQSVKADLATIIDPATGLVKGESSFLDWREQTYPLWMDPKDIFDSKCLGTNVVHAATYKILAEMSAILGKDPKAYDAMFQTIKNGINKHLWVEDRGYYGQFMYGRNYQVLSPKSETLGEALTVLYGIAGSRAVSVIQNTPTLAYGTPCIYPQESNIPPYHNDAVWPFVESYKMWAAKKVNQPMAVLHSMASIIRPAGLFLTNKENFVAGTGSGVGTAINSDRQLWSVAGGLSMFYRIIFGMEFGRDRLVFSPFVHKNTQGTFTLKKFKYGDANFDITVKGWGATIASFTIDGKEEKSHSITRSMKGVHTISIELKGDESTAVQKIVDNYFTVTAPVVTMTAGKIVWAAVDNALKYEVFKNGIRIAAVVERTYSAPVGSGTVDEYQVCAVDKNGVRSFLSEPVLAGKQIITVPLITAQGTDHIMLRSTKGGVYEFEFTVEQKGRYAIGFEYANGNGPINTDNKCAIRSMYLNNKFVGCIIMPHRGVGDWTQYGLSNMVQAELKPGKQKMRIQYDPLNVNMNYDINEARIRAMRLVQLK